MKLSAKFMNLAGAVFCTAIAAPAFALELLVPAYFYPTTHADEWQSLIEVAKRQPLSVIVNPDNGAGKALDPNYVTAIDALRAAGGKAYGYVGSDVATRNSSDIQAEIDDYLDWYALDGFFIDEVSEHAAGLDYYKDIQRYVAAKAPTLGLIGNPGTTTDNGYVDVFDTLVIYEDSAANLQTFAPVPSQSQYDESRFGMLLHDADQRTMKSLVANAATANIGFVYATDSRFDGDLWLELPAYWDAQASAVASASNVTSPLPGLPPVSPVPEPSAALMMLGGVVTLVTVARRRRRG